MTLNERLKALRCSIQANADPRTITLMRRADEALLASGILDQALKAGDMAPGFTLKDASGTKFTLFEELRMGPVVLSFYRGEWCPYCTLELKSLQAIYADIRSLGARLLAISPPNSQAPRLERKIATTFPRLQDVDLKVARGFGIAFSLDKELRPIYRKLGHSPNAKVDGDPWALPIPATYVVDQDRQIVFSHIDIDYSHRLEPSSTQTVLSSLRDRNTASRL